jgi:hypothetical protein
VLGAGSPVVGNPCCASQVLFTYHEGLRPDELLIYYGRSMPFPNCLPYTLLTPAAQLLSYSARL